MALKKMVDIYCKNYDNHRDHKEKCLKMNNSIQKSKAFFQFFCVVNVRVVCTARVVMLGLCCSTMAEGKPNYG